MMPASARTQKQIAARRARVVALRATGMSWDDIAAGVGVLNAAAARRDAGEHAAADAKTAAGPAADLAVELERLDIAERAVQQVREAAEALASASPDDDDETSSTGDADAMTLVLGAVDRLMRIHDRRARLLPGLVPSRAGLPAAGGAGKPSAIDEVAAARRRRRTRYSAAQ
jgi:hypothetical protein